ncbi:MAG: KamA family radical SAM protein [Spirochaetales bacterium]|nr:KamA family radical SAM protein [Spirochaetales bacterium]
MDPLQNYEKMALGIKGVKPKPRGYSKGRLLEVDDYSRDLFLEECGGFLYDLKGCKTLAGTREVLREKAIRLFVANSTEEKKPWDRFFTRRRDSVNAFMSMLSRRAENLAGFSLTQALWDLARELPRKDLQPGFYAEMIHLIWALEDRTADKPLLARKSQAGRYNGREAAIVRSDELDALWMRVEHFMDRYSHGLHREIIAERGVNKERISAELKATDKEWNDWKWQTLNVAKDADALKNLIYLSESEELNIRKARNARLPFGVTPFYLSLMDSIPGSVRDKSLRYQVFPPSRYVNTMADNRNSQETSDFMGEVDTSPIDLVTRRYPGIVILKPYNTCPQICVYCQRNWEIDEVLDPDAMASWEKIEAAVEWIGEHPAVHEILITGGDPMLLDDEVLECLLEMVCSLPSIHRVRIGTRTPVTLPMRFTEKVAAILGRFQNQEREIVLVTHVQHPYELNPAMALAVKRLRVHGISTYNQQVFTFYSSRRFETALLRRLLRRIGIEPYYTFLPKGKSETADYRVPISRLLQEENEEARLLPGLTRTDEAVYNVPRLGKNYLRAKQNRDLLSILPDGSRIYEFHPWEKNIVEQASYVGDTVPILEYLKRLKEERGEACSDYESIWYYF